MGGKRGTPEERFWRYIEPDLNSGCWLWSGTVNPAGYGRINIDQRIHLAHRFSWTLRHGEPSDGLCVLHRCDTPACCNPDHLFLGTRQDNVADAVAKRRVCHGERHHYARVSTADVIEIKRRATGGETQRAVARDFGLSPSGVSAIVIGRNRRYG